MEFFGNRIYKCKTQFTHLLIPFLTLLYIKVSDAVIFGLLAIYYTTETILLTFTPNFLRNEKTLVDKVVLITGGVGGIGREIVLKLAKEGAKIYVWDRNAKAIEDFKRETTKKTYNVVFHNVDVTDRKMVYKYADLIKDTDFVDIVINNAGIVCGQTLLEIPDEMIEKTFQVNVFSHYWTTKAFLPEMIRTGKGHIVTIGSLTGLLGAYKCTDYSASKFAAVGFHESLYTELKAHGHHNIKVTLVCPYFVNTGMFNGCQPQGYPMLEPKDVAIRIITSIKREEYFVTIPAISRFLIPIKNYIPAKLKWEMIHRIIKGPQSMRGLRPYRQVSEAA